MADFVVALREEVDRLREALRADPRFRRYEMTAQLLAEYEQEAMVATERPSRRSEITAAQPRRNGTGPFVRSEGSNATRWTDAAEQYLKAKGSRAQSGEIHDALVKDGVMPPDDAAKTNLTAYLSREKERFDNIKGKGQGYGLREWSLPKSETPDSSELSGAPMTNGAEPLSL
jgi:hypothetical protein